MVSVTLPSLQYHLLVALVVLLCAPFLKGNPSQRGSDEHHVVQWIERVQSSVLFRESPTEDAKMVAFDDAGLQVGRSLDKGSRSLRREKRDIQEIIAGRPVNFPPVVVKRTTDALQQILALLGGIEKALNTTTTTLAPPTSPQPPVSPQPPASPGPPTSPEPLTPPPPATTTTTPPPASTPIPPTSPQPPVSPQPPASPGPPTSPEPLTPPPPATTTTTPPPASTPIPATTPVPPKVNATSAPEGTTPSAPEGTTPDPAKNDSVAPNPPAKSSEGQPPALDPTKRPPPMRVEATTPSGNILGDQVRSLVRESGSETTVSPSNESTVPPPKAYSPRDVIIVFQALSKNAEDVMADQLNMSTVIALEKSVETLSLVNKTAAYIDRGDGMAELQIWLKLVQMSCSHALKKLEYGKAVMTLFGSSDDITILITAAFCTLALICCIVACLMGRHPLKPSRGNYALDGTPGRARPVPSTRRNTSSASSEPPERPFSVYSSPARAAVSERSNPSYSSHRSVDVDPATSYRSTANNLNYDEPRPDADDNVSDLAVAAKNERNASLGNIRPVSTRPSTKSSDYKDPRRHRSSNLARGRSNEGYTGDEVIGVRSDSESVL